MSGEEMMTMSKKKTETPPKTTLTAIAAWQAAAQAEEAARANVGAVARAVSKERGTSNRTDEQRLREVIAEIVAAEAGDALRLAAIQAGAAVDTEEAAAGDELAALRDPAKLHADLVECRDDVARIEAELADARARFGARLGQAHAATSAIVERRIAQALPPPAPLPTGPTDMMGQNTFNDPHAMIAAIEALAGAMVPFTPKYTEKLSKLREEELTLRARIEQRRLDDEQAAKEAAERKASQADDDARRAKAGRARTKAFELEAEAAAKKKRDLADAHRAREAKGAA